jgi:hypothetical protein
LVSDIPAGDGKLVNLFYGVTYETDKIVEVVVDSKGYSEYSVADP